MISTEQYYTMRLEGHRNDSFSHWSPMRYFAPPKRPYAFMLLVVVSMAALQTMMGTWVPFVVAVFLVWNVMINILKKDMIVEKCVTREMVYQNDLADPEIGVPGPMYVTEEDRNYIFEDSISDYWKLSLWRELRMFWVSLVFVAAFYLIVYAAMVGLHRII